VMRRDMQLSNAVGVDFIEPGMSQLAQMHFHHRPPFTCYERFLKLKVLKGR
jgi:hypothetical protein